MALPPMMFTALAVGFCSYLMCRGCCVALPLSCFQRLLCGFASILWAGVAVWHGPYPVYSACCVVLLLCYVQGLLCGIAPILLTALAVWFCFYVMCRLGGEKLFAGMITTPFRGHPEQYLHTLVHAHHAPLQKQALLCRGPGFKGVAEPLPHTAGVFVFDV